MIFEFDHTEHELLLMALEHLHEQANPGLPTKQVSTSGQRYACTFARNRIDELVSKLNTGGNIPEGCTPADARVLRDANHEWAQAVHDLQDAMRPFVEHSSSDECITVQLRNEDIKKARALLGGT